MSGLIGCFSSQEEDNVFSSLYFGLFALQHRGQAAMGISLIQGKNINERKGENLISDNVTEKDMDHLQGHAGLGHVKYAFRKEKLDHPMPWTYAVKNRPALLVIDGKIENSDFSPEEMIEKFYCKDEELKQYIESLKGAYAVIFVSADRLVAIRDSYGIKPLTAGKKDQITVVASESCALDSIGADHDHFLRPGEIFVVEKEGSRSIYSKNYGEHLCLFEMIYIARADSIMQNHLIYDVRHKMGELLWKESPVEADLIIGTPDSGMIAALGYAHASHIPYQKAIVRNRYVGRTFITPTDEQRKTGVKMKLSAITSLVQNKDVVLVDDSIVRGTTIRRIVAILKECGVKSIHIRISSPPVIECENLSIDIPEKEELISYGRTIEQVREKIGCDTLAFLSREGLREACGNEGYYERYFGGINPLEEEV